MIMFLRRMYLFVFAVFLVHVSVLFNFAVIYCYDFWQQIVIFENLAWSFRLISEISGSRPIFFQVTQGCGSFSIHMPFHTYRTEFTFMNRLKRFRMYCLRDAFKMIRELVCFIWTAFEYLLLVAKCNPAYYSWEVSLLSICDYFSQVFD